MEIDPMEIDISKLPYKHRFAAASMLMSKGNRLTELTSLRSERPEGRDVSRVLEGLSFYDMALSLMKPHDPSGDENQIGWCYFTVTNDEINEAISMDVFKTTTNAFEIGSLEFGRP
jgi:hypothetical protein